MKEVEALTAGLSCCWVTLTSGPVLSGMRGVVEVTLSLQGERGRVE